MGQEPMIDNVFYDAILSKVCEEVIKLYKRDSKKYGLCGSVVLDKNNKMSFGIYHPQTGVHAERDAIENYKKKYGKLDDGCIILTTCSPCTDPMRDRKGKSCRDMIDNTNIKYVYAGFRDPSQHTFEPKNYKLVITDNDKLNTLCAMFATSWLDKS
jgi:pyrimidine deaminase RibD-like protein